MDKEPTSGDQEISPPSGLEDSQTPPASESAEDTDGATRTRPRWMIPVVTAAAVVVLIAAGLICWRVVSNRQHTQAVERCSGAVARLEKPAGGAAARTARYQEAAGISSDQVKDVKTVIAMARAVKNAGGIKPQPVRCDASMKTQDLEAAADKAKDLNDRYDKLDRAAKAVLASRDAKDLDDARTALAAKREEASRLLGDSDGKVTDNTTRETLQQAIGQAEQTKGDKAKAWRDAVGPLQSAIDQVNASMQAKTQADQQAAEEAAQAAAQQAQAVQQARPSYGRGGGGGWSAPAPAAPAPSVPRGGNSSDDFNWEQWLQTQVPLGNGCNSAGVCAIG
ncbi:hypothetical protein [Bifidobacterium coryneforme]|uniref:Colicin transporter n=1 Tax=Bifidobacterium [indicum] DSM 20214 = LMG 11587 TaxID=1341694 RepID=A0A087VVJ9_9BIFI|nr:MULTISPECIES: hypothetical protein [Bifidobacterium]AIC92540.1 hypothetical protein BINDI_1285 [Bifidobacterium indicum LMG 11587 = DSM 20214]AII75355.1 hypothetical protein BCOR_1355 [Bifidobacterium coryneforme]